MSDLQVILEELEKGNLLALKLVLDDWSVKEALKRVKHLELADDSVTVVK